ncbi:mannose-1-phosphate guanylyltransferase/mannose-6-phosphate isomerase [Paracoccaceae bacterium]|nr:mannose-1-phosphate guanylyltransferase/mannose-6-phosphate isomerase [Paracoccaceae bacterium]
MKSVVPVLLAGGSGTRLWPLSRRSYPKQFSKLTGKHTLFQQVALRLTSSRTLKFLEHITLTNNDFRFIITDQLLSLGIKPGPILIEPQGKNTAPPILAASIFATESDPNAILLVAPSDHLIPDTEGFHNAVVSGLPSVLEGKIVTFGIFPESAEQGYGYLKVLKKKSELAYPVLKFVEKPSKELAAQMVNSQSYLWNAGIFLFKAADMISAFKSNDPTIYQQVKDSIDKSKTDLGFVRLNSLYWDGIQPISIDYAIMEKVNNLVAVPFASGWSDLGDWDAVWKQGKKNPEGVMTTNNAYAIDCKNSLLRAENENQTIVGIGLKDIIAIAMPDAVLVANKSKAQQVKDAVELLKVNSVEQAEIFPKDHRPWGWFESLVIGGGFQVKRIHVNPGASLSLQSHRYRSEHWVVVEGTAKVTIENLVKIVSAGQSIFVPLGAKHRMENPGIKPTVVIEIQIGSYLGEDDIVRYEDIYARDTS